MACREAAESSDPALANEPTESTDRADPTHPIESTEPTEPIDSSDPLQPMHRIESSERMDHRDEPISPLFHVVRVRGREGRTEVPLTGAGPVGLLDGPSRPCHRERPDGGGLRDTLA